MARRRRKPRVWLAFAAATFAWALTQTRLTGPLIIVDGFAHQGLAGSQSGSGFIGCYDSVTNNPPTFDVDIVRNELFNLASIFVAENGANNFNCERSIAAGNRSVVVSYYFRVAAAPAGSSIMFYLATATRNAQIKMTSAGAIQYIVAAGGSAQTITGNFADSQWHRVDLYYDVSTTTFTLDCQVDGRAGTQSTLAAQTSSDITKYGIGSTQNTDSLTFWMQDLVGSGQAGDYPIGDHHVWSMGVTADGTSTLGTTNHIQDQAGSQANLYSKLTAMPGGTSTYITYASTTLGDAASNFAELQLKLQDGLGNNYGSIPDSVVWDVEGYLAGFAAGTAADTADLQVLTGHGGTLIDHVGNGIDYSASISALGFYRRLLTRPAGGWTPANLAAAVAQWGRSSDTNPQPRLAAFLLEYAAPEFPQATTDPGRVVRQAIQRAAVM